MGTPGAVEARESAKPAQWRLNTTFWLDAALLLSLCALQTIDFTGLVVHEWLGLAMVGMVFAHLLFSWSWVASLSRRLFAVQSARARINYLLNLSLFGATTAVIFSGILISQKAIPTLTGARATDMDWRWDTLHHQFSETVLMLAGFHLAINWIWVSPPDRRFSAASWKASCEIGAHIIKAWPPLAGCRCVCRIDGNLWPFSAASFAGSGVASVPTASSIRAARQSVSNMHW